MEGKYEMKLLITGADRPLSAAAAQHLAGRHELRLTGYSGAPSDAECAKLYRQADLCDAETVPDLVDGVDAVLHFAEFDPQPLTGPNAGHQLLTRATLGAYLLCNAAREAGVRRIVVAGTLKVFDGYPDSYLIDEQWEPRPAPEPEVLAPYLCEQVVREFPREGGITGICLRFLPLGIDSEANTRLDDALQAIDRALEIELGSTGYRWHVFHVASSPRFLSRQAQLTLGFEPEGAE